MQKAPAATIDTLAHAVLELKGSDVGIKNISLFSWKHFLSPESNSVKFFKILFAISGEFFFEISS